MLSFLKRGKEDVPEPEVTKEEQQPTYVKAEDFDQVKTILLGLQQQFQTMGANFDAIAAERSQRQESAAPPETNPYTPVNEEELAEAFENQDFKKFNALQKRQAAYDEWNREKRFSERVSALESTGMSAIANLTKNAVKTSLPYYDRFQKEIEGYVSSLHPSQRLNPDVYKIAHDAVVGANMSTIINEEIEKKIRAQVEDPLPNTRGNAQTRQTPQGQQRESGIAYSYTEGDRNALEGKGLDMETFVRRLGYKDIAEYEKWRTAEVA